MFILTTAHNHQFPNDGTHWIPVITDLHVIYTKRARKAPKPKGLFCFFLSKKASKGMTALFTNPACRAEARKQSQFCTFVSKSHVAPMKKHGNTKSCPGGFSLSSHHHTSALPTFTARPQHTDTDCFRLQLCASQISNPNPVLQSQTSQQRWPSDTPASKRHFMLGINVSSSARASWRPPTAGRK